MEKIKWIEDYINEAFDLANVGDHEKAIQVLKNLLFDEPGYCRLHYVLGVIFFNYASDIRNAELHLMLAIRFDEQYAEPYGLLCRLLQDEERWDESIEISRKGVKARKADKCNLLMNTGQAYELKKRFGRAIRYYRKAMSHSADLWNCRVLELNIERCERKKESRKQR